MRRSLVGLAGRKCSVFRSAGVCIDVLRGVLLVCFRSKFVVAPRAWCVCGCGEHIAFVCCVVVSRVVVCLRCSLCSCSHATLAGRDGRAYVLSFLFRWRLFACVIVFAWCAS